MKELNMWDRMGVLVLGAALFAALVWAAACGDPATDETAEPAATAVSAQPEEAVSSSEPPCPRCSTRRPHS